MSTEENLGQNLTHSHQSYSAKATWRNLWFARAGDVIVMPERMKDDFLSYMGETLGFDMQSIAIVTPQTAASEHPDLSDNVLTSSSIFDQLRPLADTPEIWTVMPCCYTEGVAELACKLGIGDCAELQFAAQHGADVLNRKTHFRQFAAGLKLPTPSGTIVKGPGDLARAIGKHLSQTGTIIIKRDNGAGGMGNLTLTTGSITPLPGSYETRPVSEDIDMMAQSLWSEMTNRWNHALVVEAYYAAAHRFYLEYFIDGDGSACFLNSGTIRVRLNRNPNAKRLVWVGLDLPADIPMSSMSAAASLSMRFVMFAAQMGYRGYINIDAILVANTNQLLFNEVNARWGGGTILHALAERLLGDCFAKGHVVSSLRNVKSPPLRDTLYILQECNLQFRRELKEGVIVLMCDEELTNTSEYLLIASSRHRIREIEAVLLERLMQ